MQMDRTKPANDEATVSDVRESAEYDGAAGQPQLGTVVLLQNPVHKVVLEQGNIVVKSGKHISPAEAAGLKVASEAGLPAPPLHSVTSTNGVVEIRMGYIQGRTLEELWPSMSADQKQDTAHQLRHIVEQMRALEPPPSYIGCCDGTGIQDTRVRFTYHAPPCATESEFNDYLDSSLFRQIPPLLRAAFRSQLRLDHRVVFTHGDLTPRNILIQDGKITGIVDWEESGWYPEY